MAGLSVLLETPKTLPKNASILNKISNLSLSFIPPSISTPSQSFHTSTFLESCYLCRKRLQEGKDIYMYRGDRAFCSVECRRRQIHMDEESGKRDSCSVVADAATAAAGGAPAKRHRKRAAGKEGEVAGTVRCGAARRGIRN